VLAQRMVTGATRFLVTLIGRLETRTSEAVIGSALGCGE
jgi:hypothetical protein